MSIRATYSEGVFKPTEDARGAVQGEMYRVFSEEELRELTEELHWLKAADRSFEFWNNDDDAVYDKL